MEWQYQVLTSTWMHLCPMYSPYNYSQMVCPDEPEYNDGLMILAREICCLEYTLYGWY